MSQNEQDSHRQAGQIFGWAVANAFLRNEKNDELYHRVVELQEHMLSHMANIVITPEDRAFVEGAINGMLDRINGSTQA